jgi:flagellar basal body-associated protein FliL
MEDDNKQAVKKERRIFFALGVIAFVVVFIILGISAFHASSVPATSKGQPAGHEMFRSSKPWTAR